MRSCQGSFNLRALNNHKKKHLISSTGACLKGVVGLPRMFALKLASGSGRRALVKV